MFEFLLQMALIIVIAVLVNIFMEKFWTRRLGHGITPEITVHQNGTSLADAQEVIERSIKQRPIGKHRQ